MPQTPKHTVAAFPPSLWSVASWGNKTEAIKHRRGPGIRSSLLLHLTQHLSLHAGPCLAWSRLQNLSCVSPSCAAHECPYWAGVLALQVLLGASSWAGVSHQRVTFSQTTHAITLGDEGHFGWPWKVSIHRSALEGRGGAARNGSSECSSCPALGWDSLEKGRGHLQSCTRHPDRHPWADTGSPFPQGRAEWEPKPVPCLTDRTA